MQKPTEIDQNGAKERSKIDLGSKSVKTVTASTCQNLRSDIFLRAFGATWVILVAILAAAGPQLGPKIEHFEIKIEKLVSQKASKNDAEKV